MCWWTGCAGTGGGIRARAGREYGQAARELAPFATGGGLLSPSFTPESINVNRRLPNP